MKVFIPKETGPEETRIPLLPVDSGKLVQLGAQVEVEAGSTKDGYATQLTEEQLDIQRKTMAKQCAQSDVVNPAARKDQSSPLWGMPMIDVDRARTCIVLKRSLNPGFAGVENPLFFKDNTRMLFGDAKTSIGSLVSEFKQ